MTNSDEQLKTESSESFSKKAEEMLPFGSKLALDTIQSLARKIGGKTEGEGREWAKEIERLAGQLIESYEKQSHRLEEWARGIGPPSPSLDRNRPS
jgi:intein/homing endonuclease